MCDVGLESVSLMRPATILGNKHTPGWAGAASKAISWALPDKFKEIHVDHLGQAMVNATLKALDEGGPPVATYEGKPLFALVPK